MNQTTRKTRACSLETLDAGLRSAIRAHSAKYGLADSENDILMCCETLSTRQRKGLFGGIQTTLSAVYVTPRWLVWAASNGHNDAAAGTAQLKNIDVRDFEHTAQHAATPDQGLNITGRYTEPNRTGITFIVLDGETDGRRFRQVLQQAVAQAVAQPALV